MPFLVVEVFRAEYFAGIKFAFVFYYTISVGRRCDCFIGRFPIGVHWSCDPIQSVFLVRLYKDRCFDPNSTGLEESRLSECFLERQRGTSKNTSLGKVLEGFGAKVNEADESYAYWRRLTKQLLYCQAEPDSPERSLVDLNTQIHQFPSIEIAPLSTHTQPDMMIVACRHLPVTVFNVHQEHTCQAGFMSSGRPAFSLKLVALYNVRQEHTCKQDLCRQVRPAFSLKLVTLKCPLGISFPLNGHHDPSWRRTNSPRP